MNSAQLHSELLDSGERLDLALAGARAANVIGTGALSCTKWQNRLRMAHQQVEREAECYAVALRDYRVAMMAELAPSELTHSSLLGGIARHRRRSRTISAPCGGNLGRAGRSLRKEVSSERSPAPTRLSKTP